MRIVRAVPEDAAVVARRFYERHGFNIEPGAEGRMLCYIGEFG